MRHANDDEAVTDQALAWRAKLEHDDADWGAYILWLEADPRHRAAYNSLDLIDAAVDDHREGIAQLLRPSPPDARLRARMPRVLGVLGGSVAAGLALLLAVPVFWGEKAPRSFEAGASATRVVALAEGINVTLSPASRIVVRGEDDEKIELTKGEAFFDVKHDPTRLLTVSAGGYSISDIGTRFSINIAGDAFRVGVSEGTVSVSSERTETIELAAGKQLLSAGDRLTVSPVAVTEVGSWRSGRLSYSNAPLPMVAADISRYSGRPVRIDPSLEKAHFSGSLVIGNGSRLLSDLATVIGAEVRHDENGDRIGAAAR